MIACFCHQLLDRVALAMLVIERYLVKFTKFADRDDLEMDGFIGQTGDQSG